MVGCFRCEKVRDWNSKNFRGWDCGDMRVLDCDVANFWILPSFVIKIKTDYPWQCYLRGCE